MRGRGARNFGRAGESAHQVPRISALLPGSKSKPLRRTPSTFPNGQMISKPPIPSPTSHTAYDSIGSCELPASLARVPPCADAAVEKSKNRGGWGQLSVGATFPPHLEPYSPIQGRSRYFEGQANSLMESHGRTISVLGLQTPARSKPRPLYGHAKLMQIRQRR